MKIVKCCASCEYREDIEEWLDTGHDIRCSAYVNRRVKVYGICETFYPDINIWEPELETKNPAIIYPDELERCLRSDPDDTGWEK